MYAGAISGYPGMQTEGSSSSGKRRTAEMAFDDIEVEPHVLKFMSQIEEPSGGFASRPVDIQNHPSPKLRRSTRKLSEPAHKNTAPAKPILKCRADTSESTLSQDWPLPRTNSHPRNHVPLTFASRKVPPLVDPSLQNAQDGSICSGSTATNDDLFYSPASTLLEGGAGNSKVTQENGSGEWEKNSDYCNGPKDSVFYADPSTPLPTPKLRASFSQDLPYQGYPLTPRNTIRTKRRPPPIVDELDRQRNNAPFPSYQSFTFSPPAGTPSPGDFPLPPTVPAVGASATDRAGLGGAAAAAPTPALNGNPTSSPPRRVSWRPSFPSFTRRSNDKPQRPEAERAASKRKSFLDVEPGSKRRKVQFVLPPGHKEHPPIKRRPTPYYEPFSSKVKRFLSSLFAPFGKKSEEEKAQIKAAKSMKKEAKLVKKEREELVESFRHSDDTVD